MAEKKAETRLGWTTIVVPNELDAHMSDTGQLDANVAIIAGLWNSYNAKGPHTIYVPGCGTGQLFAALNHRTPLKDNYLFTDIRREFLDKLERRVTRDVKYRTKVDDIEASKITEKFDAVVLVLVLEHVDWKKALSNVLQTQPEMLFIIIQVNGDADTAVVTKKRTLKPSIQAFADASTPELLDTEELENYLSGLGYVKEKMMNKPVPDHKIMRGLSFVRKEN